MFVRFGPPEGGLIVGDTTTQPPTVILDYTAYRFRVQDRQVVRAEFRSRWKEGTIRDVRLFDSLEQVTSKLGEPTEAIKNSDGTSRLAWTDQEHHRVSRVLFDEKHRCIGVYVIPEAVAPDRQATPPAAPPPAMQPPAQAVIDAVGGPLSAVLARFGVPQHGLEVVPGDPPSVRVNYGAYAFRVREKVVSAAEFRVDWKGDTIPGVRLFDSREDVLRQLGPANSMTKSTTSERHNWVDEQSRRIHRVLLDDQHGCIRVTIEATESAGQR